MLTHSSTPIRYTFDASPCHLTTKGRAEQFGADEQAFIYSDAPYEALELLKPRWNRAVRLARPGWGVRI